MCKSMSVCGGVHSPVCKDVCDSVWGCISVPKPIFFVYISQKRQFLHGSFIKLMFEGEIKFIIEATSTVKLYHGY